MITKYTIGIFDYKHVIQIKVIMDLYYTISNNYLYVRDLKELARVNKYTSCILSQIFLIQYARKYHNNLNLLYVLLTNSSINVWDFEWTPEQVNYATLWCIVNDKPNYIDQLLCRMKDINIQMGRESWTPLHCACHYGRLEIVEKLLKKGASVHAFDYNDRTPLIHCCIKYGLSEHIPINYKYTTYHEIIHLLLKYGAEIDVEDTIGNTPLIYASLGNDYILAKLLLEKGADVDHPKSNRLTIDYNYTPIMLAQKRQYYQLVELYSSYGALTLNHEY